MRNEDITDEDTIMFMTFQLLYKPLYHSKKKTYDITVIIIWVSKHVISGECQSSDVSAPKLWRMKG